MESRSSHRPQRFEVGEPILCLALDSFLLARTADRTEIAPGARAFCRRRHEKAVLHGAIDDFENLETLPFRVVVDGNRMLGETTGGRAVKETPFHDMDAKALLDGGAVQNGLQHRAAADDEILVRAVLSGLVIRDPVHTEIGAVLDNVDRPAQDEAAIHHNRLLQAAWIASLVAQAEAEFEVFRDPRAFARELPQPDTEVPAELGDLIAPDAFDRWREPFFVLVR